MESLINIGLSIIASLIMLGFGYIIGRIRERKKQQGTPLEDYPFYPFKVNENHILSFDLDLFNQAVTELLKTSNHQAGRQLVLIGEQNNVKHLLKTPQRKKYIKLYKKYKGDQILDESVNYLKNYKRIVQHIGDSFPDSGIEILLHNLTNPSKALYYIKNNVTGRNIEAPATNLVLDLKRRNSQNEDKINYELNIGARKFKCTTIPIYKEKDGLVGAICINIDYNYINDEVRRNPQLMNSFLDSLIKTDMVLNENILSKSEFQKAQEGKRHFRDF
ncbi:PAS domain-containing protein [Mangrovimonas sp. YM274]|uniref:PAS domain-containing protein n=1 Tax=Mangrovimonas sp. YM274 TaxID=3070660 RepID=UPI0027DC97F5|nr:PAS domain-containing protein [Mangrovimonas sp. YM274]WMI69371.1 PAS domain-containing protein [Mangrovimonas sp. YM274]